MTLLALDSGLERTGFAVFTRNDSEWQLNNYGCVVTDPSLSLVVRLNHLSDEIGAIVTKSKSEIIIMEKIFFNVNKKTAILVAQAQGAILSLSGRLGLTVEFLAPLQIKQALTGYGRADKKQVEKMVCLLLGIEKAPQPDDVVDAIACGLAYTTTANLRQYI